MVCKNCGKLNDEINNYCIYCNAQLFNSKDRSSSFVIEKYESDLGFSNPDSKYINSQVNFLQVDMGDLSNKVCEPEVNETQPQLLIFKISRRLLLGLFSFIVITVLLIFSHIDIDKNMEFISISKDAIEVFTDNVTGTTYIFNTKGEILNKLVRYNDSISFVIKYITDTYYNPDHTAAILINADILYYVNAKEVIELPHDINITAFDISDDGKFVIYSTGLKENVDSLYLYDIEKRKEELIDQVEGLNFTYLNILPDGKTVTYATIYYLTLEVEAFMFTIGDEPKSAGEDITVLAVSDDKEYTYYYDNTTIGSRALYVRHHEKSVPLSYDYSNIYFNKDYSEILYSDSKYTYISVKGRERQQVADVPLSTVFMPNKCISGYNIGLNYTFNGIDSFVNKVILLQDGTLKLLNDQYQTKDISSLTSDQYFEYLSLSENGNDLLYETSDSKIIKVSDLSGECRQEIFIEHVDSIVASSDLSQVYYRIGDHLFYKNEKREIKEIDDNVSKLCYNVSNDTAFYLKDFQNGVGTLYYSSKGKKAQPIPGGDAVLNINKWNRGIAYLKEIDGNNNSYYNIEGVDFKLLEDEVDVTKMNINFID